MLWNFEIDAPEGRPLFHPLCLPSGRTLTDCRPKDHIWHFGYWFSWKYINGFNYWETDQAKKMAKGEGEGPRVGETRVTKKSVVKDGLGCTVELELAYGPRGTNVPVLVESRNVVIDPPDSDGGYAITVHHRFTAIDDCLFDRTPPHGSVASGKWGGGYAGPTLRLAPEIAKEFSVRGGSAGEGSAAVTGRETGYVDFIDPKSGECVRFTQLEAPASGKFYVWPDRRFTNASPLYDGPLSLKAGEKLFLAYRLEIGIRK